MKNSDFLTKIIIFAALAIALPCAALADEVLDRARSLLDQKNPQAALALLQPLEGARAGNVEYDYLLGISALDAGDAQQAVFALERVLAVNPNFLQARAEIARAYVELGERDNAKREFQNVLAANPPAEVRQTIDRLLNTLIAKGRRVWGNLELGVGTDSNVNSATGRGQIAIPAFGGAVVSLGAGGSQLGDNFTGLAGAVNLLEPFTEEWSLVGGAAGNFKLNNTQTQFDTNSFDGNLGARWARGRDAVTAGLQVQSFSVASTRFRDSTGVTAQWQHYYSETGAVTAFTQVSDLRYPTQAIRNARRSVFGLAFADGLDGPRNGAVFASLYGAEEKETASGVPYLGHKAIGGRLGGQLDIAPKAVLFTSVSLEQRRYGGQEPLYLTSRNDNQFDFRVGISYSFAQDWMLTPQFAYTDNKSNITTSQYTRNLAAIVLRKDF